MWGRFRSAMHERVHGAKVLRHERNSAQDGTSHVDWRDMISASCSSSGSEHDGDHLGSRRSCGRSSTGAYLGVEFIVCSVADVVSSDTIPYYFYVCIGEVGDSISQKRRRHLQTSGIITGKWPSLSEDQSHYLMSIDRLEQPEITVRFSRSSIIGQDKFLGEYRICLPPELSDNYTPQTFQVGPHGMIACKWRVVPYDPSWGKSTRFSYILPQQPCSGVSEQDKLGGLVDTVRKSLGSFSERENHDMNSSQGMEIWLHTLLSTVTMAELEGIVLHVSLVDLLRNVHSAASVIAKRSFQVPPCDFSLLARVRTIKAIVAIWEGSSKRSTGGEKKDDESRACSTVFSLIAGCPVEFISSLRDALDKGESDLFWIVYKFFQCDDLREEVIQLFRKSGAGTTPPIHIMSEIDQVVFSPFGSTVSWPEGPVPGFKILFDASSNGVTFVSNKPNHAFATTVTRKLVRQAGMSGCPVLFDYTDHWNMYRRLFPKTRFIWFTDNEHFARKLMETEIDRVSSGTEDDNGKICTTFVMVPKLSLSGPVLVDTGIVACNNYIQACIACCDRNYVSEECLVDKVIPEFGRMIDNLVQDLKRRRTRNKQLLKERIVELKIDFEKLKSRIPATASLHEQHVSMSKISSANIIKQYTNSMVSNTSEPSPALTHN